MARNSRIGRWSTAWIAGLIAAAGAGIALPAATASAQIRMSTGPGEGAGSPGGITRAALDRYAKALGLDEAQREAAAALREAYAEATRQAAKDFQSKMRSLEESAEDGDADVYMRQMPEVMGKHHEKMRQAEQSLLADIKALLTPEQAEQGWPRLERMRRREQWLRTGTLSGSNVDLHRLVESLNLPEEDRARLGETLEQYEVDLDRVLEGIQRRAEDRAREQGLNRKDGPGARIMVLDGDSMREHLKQQREDSAKVKEINQRYTRLLAAQLPDDLRAKLEEQFRRTAFNQIYRETHAARRLAAAEKFDDLTPAQRERLHSIADRYRREAAAASDRWAAAQQRAEEDGRATGGGMGGMLMLGQESDVPEDLRAARQARRDLDRQIDDELAGLLSEEQQARLPQQQVVRRGPGGPHDEEVEFILEGGEGNAVVFSHIEAIEDGGEGGGVIAQRIIVATSGPGEEEPEKPAKEERRKKSEPK